MGWINGRELNGDCFYIKKLSKSNIPLDYYLDKIDLDNYWIYKNTNTFIRVEVEDIGKYAGYIFFRKDLYCKDYIDNWIKEIKNIDKEKFMYLVKPFPRVGILKKLEVV